MFKQFFKYSERFFKQSKILFNKFINLIFYWPSLIILNLILFNFNILVEKIFTIYTVYANKRFFPSVNFYGITQDPKTSNYMIILQEMKGNLRSNLKMEIPKSIDWKYWKYRFINEILDALLNLHRFNLVHSDFHSGNILLMPGLKTESNDYFRPFISDLGLSKPADKSINSNDVYGVIPYMAPEVLRGQPYTKAADIYSFGIIMWECIFEIPAFNDTSHNLNLAFEICKGYRPIIIKGTDPAIAKFIEKCWDSDPEERPTAEELIIMYSRLNRNMMEVPGNKILKDVTS